MRILSTGRPAQVRKHCDVLATQRRALTNFEACRSPPFTMCDVSRGRQQSRRGEKQVRSAAIRYFVDEGYLVAIDCAAIEEVDTRCSWYNKEEVMEDD
jgi:hypothetical protein